MSPILDLDLQQGQDDPRLEPPGQGQGHDPPRHPHRDLDLGAPDDLELLEVRLGRGEPEGDEAVGGDGDEDDHRGRGARGGLGQGGQGRVHQDGHHREGGEDAPDRGQFEAQGNGGRARFPGLGEFEIEILEKEKARYFECDKRGQSEKGAECGFPVWNFLEWRNI